MKDFIIKAGIVIVMLLVAAIIYYEYTLNRGLSLQSSLMENMHKVTQKFEAK